MLIGIAPSLIGFQIPLIYIIERAKVKRLAAHHDIRYCLESFLRVDAERREIVVQNLLQLIVDVVPFGWVRLGRPLRDELIGLWIMIENKVVCIIALEQREVVARLNIFSKLMQ
ncbi:hypothetical protein [Paenibacillus sp. SN-8-1]|uniref:hypothetical protein n=1 Tax=Paenibacillus sp. SN-8-1 TaxID=3435409 RepID=UPI003D9AB387